MLKFQSSFYIITISIIMQMRQLNNKPLANFRSPRFFAMYKFRTVFSMPRSNLETSHLNKKTDPFFFFWFRCAF